jgi:serine carboxypeptidase-like clade 1
MTRVLCLLLISITAVVSSKHLVKQLPDYDGPNLNQYTGYLTVDGDHGRALFYWFIESQNNPKTDPLIFWFQVISELPN